MTWERRFERGLAGYADDALPVLRLGFGSVMLLAGADKLVAPADWTAYLAAPFAALWPLPVAPSMIANGVVEVAFGLAILADRYTALAAAVVAVSMIGVLVDLAVAAALSGRFVDILIRDLGITALAAGVALLAADETGDADEGETGDVSGRGEE
ncbi:MAG: DoxX family membrane protein [Salinigranum sp.]